MQLSDDALISYSSLKTGEMTDNPLFSDPEITRGASKDNVLYSTNSSTENETLFSQYPEGLLDIAGGFCIFFTIVGVTGNLITILALTKSHRLHNATTSFIISLCCADLLFCCFPLPLSATSFLERRWNYGNTLCKFFPLFRYSNGAVSIFSVIAITINRYIRIVHPQQYSKIYRPFYVGIMIAALWISAVVLLSFPLFEIWGKLGYDPKVGTCTILPLNGKSPKMFIYIAAFGLPSFVFVICYSRIYCVVKNASRNVRLTEASGLSQVTQPGQKPSGGFQFGRYKWDLSDAPRITRDRKELKILKIMLVIFITYVICYFPVSFVKIFKKEDDLHVLNIVGYMLVYFSSCINPVIYVVMSDEYRQAYLQLFTRKTISRNLN